MNELIQENGDTDHLFDPDQRWDVDHDAPDGDNPANEGASQPEEAGGAL